MTRINVIENTPQQQIPTTVSELIANMAENVKFMHKAEAQQFLEKGLADFGVFDYSVFVNIVSNSTKIDVAVKLNDSDTFTYYIIELNCENV